MARLVKHTETGPREVKAGEESVWVCMCGLSSSYPVCDGRHSLARKQEVEGKLYRYEGGTAVEVDDIGDTTTVS